MNGQKSQGVHALAQLLPSVKDLDEFSVHDAALKFWLPEVVLAGVVDLAKRNGNSLSETLRQFLVQHCFGVLAYQLLLERDRKVFRDDSGPVFANKPGDTAGRPGKRRIETYWLPDLGKSICPVKVWLPAVVKSSLDALAAHVGLTASHYTREIVISRLLGHARLPMREKMLDTVDMAEAAAWEAGKEVAHRQVEETELTRMLDGEFRQT